MYIYNAETDASAVIASVPELHAYLNRFFEEETVQKYCEIYDDAYFNNQVLLTNICCQAFGTSPFLSVENVTYQGQRIHILTKWNMPTFAEDVILQDETIEKPWILIHTPINTVSEYQKNGNAKINYNSKTDDTSW